MISASVIIAASLVLSAASVAAQPASNQADVLFKQGRDLMAAGKLGEACTALEESLRLDPRVTTLINLAGCREKLGQLATARALFLDAERQTRTASDAAMTQLHKVALERAFKLEPRVSKLTIRVPEQSKLGGLEILRNGQRVPAELWNRELPVDGGTYTIAGHAPGADEWSTQVTLAPEADARTVDVPDLRSKAAEQPPPAAVATSPGSPLQAQDQPHRPGVGLPLTVGVGALALLGGALGFSLSATSTYDQAKAERADQAKRDSLETSANRKRYLAEGLAVAGVGCTAVAVWLYVRHRAKRTESTSARTGHLMLAPSGSGIGVIGQF